MKPTALSIDIAALQVTLFDKPSVEDEIKESLFRLCSPPQTVEDIDFFLEKIAENPNGSYSVRQVVQVDIAMVDKNITKAKFLLVEGEDDYI